MEKKFINLSKNFSVKNSSVGVPEIDAQHEHLINLINKLSKMCLERDEVSDIAFAMMIKQTLYFIQFHMNCEKELMEETAYPELEVHNQFHHVFFMNFLKQIRAFESRDCFAPEKLPDFLYEWLNSHLIMDTDMGLHLRKSGYLVA